MKRIFDIFFSLAGIALSSPVLLIIGLLIKLESKGSILYSGERIGQKEKLFKCYKFRSMRPDSDKSSITVGDRDPRITKMGAFLRKSKLDELPQLINVLKGDMSFVGPRPDVPKYKKYYKKYYPDYYDFKPGITSPSSIYFVDESNLYIGVDDPEKIYIQKTIPLKIKLDKKYFESISLAYDLKLIIKTLFRINSNRK